MPGPLKRILHERFALMYPGLAAKGLGLGEIYSAAGGQAATKRAREVMGSRIFARPDVKERITELAKPAAAKAARDAEHYLGRFDEVFTGAISDGEYGHAVRANELSARMTGHLIDRAEIRTSIAFDELRTVEQAADALLADGDVEAALAGIEALRDAVIERAAAIAKLVNGSAVTKLPTEPNEPETSET
jgi:hypothetical protein